MWPDGAGCARAWRNWTSCSSFAKRFCKLGLIQLRSLLPALLGDLIEAAPIALEHRRLSHVLLIAPANDVRIARVQLHQAGRAAATLAGNQCGTRPPEEIRDHVASLAAIQQRALDQFDGLHCGMQAVRRGLVLLPQRALALVAIPCIALAGHMRVENRLMPELVTAESPCEGVLGPDHLATDFEAGGFQSILELALPGRWMADVERGARLHDAAVVPKGGRQELAELLGSHPVALDGEPILGVALVIHVVWRVREDEVSASVHEPRDVAGVRGIAH